MVISTLKKSFFYVTEEDLINLRKLVEHQKNHRALKIKNGILKQTHDVKLAETLSPITKKLDETSKKIGVLNKKSNSENKMFQEIIPVEIDSDNSEGDNTKLNRRSLPNSSIFSELITKTPVSLMSSSNSLRIKAFPPGPTILGVPIYFLGGDTLRIRDNYYELVQNYVKPYLLQDILVNL